MCLAPDSHHFAVNKSRYPLSLERWQQRQEVESLVAHTSHSIEHSAHLGDSRFIEINRRRSECRKEVAIEDNMLHKRVQVKLDGNNIINYLSSGI